MKKKGRAKSFIFILLATILYGSYGIFSRQIGSDFQSFSQNYVRSGIIIVFLLVFALLKKVKLQRIIKKDLGWLLAWLLSGSITFLMLFISFNKLSISTTYFLFYSTSILTGFLVGGVLFKEKLNIWKIVSLCLILIGIFCIYSVEIAKELIPYTFMALLAGSLIGFWNTVSRKISENYHIVQMTLMGTFATGIVGLVGAVAFNESIPPLSSVSWLWILLFSAVELMSSVFVILGFKKLEAQVASSIMPMEIVFGTLFGILFYSESISLMVIIGGACILGGAILSALGGSEG